jgi:uncharacterized protein
MSLKNEYKELLIKIINKHLPKCKIILFGSYATGNERVGSDIDLALDNETPISRDLLLNILIEIEDTTIPMKVDLVDLQIAPKELKENIKKEGLLWKN